MPSACGPTQTQSHMQYWSFIVKANMHLRYATTMQTPSLKEKNFRTFLLRQMEKRIKRENVERKKKSRINMTTSPREKWRSSIIASVGENETFFSFPYAFGRVWRAEQTAGLRRENSEQAFA